MIRSILIVIILLISANAYAVVIDRVEITGNKRVPQTRIDRYLVKAGDEFDPAKVSQSIKDLHNSLFFSEVNVDAAVVGSEFVVTYILQETPLIGGIEFRGNDEFKDDKFQDLLAVRVGETLNFTRVGTTLKNLRDYYEKERYYSVDVQYEVVYRNESSVTLIFDISEGVTSRVYNIWFYGNEFLTNDEIKEAMATKEKDFWSRLNSSGVLMRDRMEYDRELVRELYMSMGYIDVQVGEPEIAFQEDLSRLNYLVRINEGKRYKIRDVRFDESLGILPMDNLSALTLSKSGDWFNVTEFRNDVHRLTEAYSELGYARAFVDSSPSINPIDLEVDLLFTIVPNNIYHINRIRFKGNESTWDNVLRREFDIAEGERYNSVLIREAERNLYATGFFETVSVTQSYPDDSTADIDVEVTEKRNNTIALSLMYSNQDGPMGSVEYQHINAFGMGSTVGLKAVVAERQKQYSINYQEPWIFDQPYSAGFRVVYDDTEYYYNGRTDYQRDAIIAQVNVGHQLIKRRLYLNLGIAHERVDIHDVHEDASSYIKRQAGMDIINSVTPTITYQNLNNNLDPSDGYKLSANVKYADSDIVGGTADFAKLGLKGNYYMPLNIALFPDTGFVMALNLEGGYIWALDGKSLPVDERYYLGGMHSVRGFGYRDIGPMDEEGEPYGGTSYYQGNLEVWVPIFEGNMSIRAVTFVDMGQVFEQGKLMEEVPRYSAGAGLRFFTPMGLIRLEYGIKLDKKADEDSGQLEFTVGSVF